jgi:hypothetical protein
MARSRGKRRRSRVAADLARLRRRRESRSSKAYREGTAWGYSWRIEGPTSPVVSYPKEDLPGSSRLR